MQCGVRWEEKVIASVLYAEGEKLMWKAFVDARAAKAMDDSDCAMSESVDALLRPELSDRQCSIMKVMSCLPRKRIAFRAAPYLQSRCTVSVAVVVVVVVCDVECSHLGQSMMTERGMFRYSTAVSDDRVKISREQSEQSSRLRVRTCLASAVVCRMKERSSWGMSDGLGGYFSISVRPAWQSPPVQEMLRVVSPVCLYLPLSTAAA